METTPITKASLLGEILEFAQKNGAESADAIWLKNTSLTASCRLGSPEDLQRSEGNDFGLRVFIGCQHASVSSSDTSIEALKELTLQAIRMAKAVPEDPYCGLADSSLLISDWPDLDILDQNQVNPETLLQTAKIAEDAALSVKGVTNSQGGEAGYEHAEASLATSNGFMGKYQLTRHSISVSVLAGSGTGMESDYEYSVACHLDDLQDAQKIGLTAGQKSVRRLGSQKAQSGQIPVIYDPRVSNSLLRHLSNAISGASIARGSSFLANSLGQKIFSSAINIYDDPYRERGLRSRPFDGEGVGKKITKIINNGTLTSWLLDSRSARQLQMISTGHASRSTSGAPTPSPTNFYLEAGSLTPQSLMADIKNGLYVTDLIGMGVNTITGDYSRGVSGFMIENGEISQPVSEITIAGNLREMFQNLTPASDLEWRYGVDSPTVRIDGMTVSGQ